MIDATVLLTHRARLSANAEAIVDVATGQRYRFSDVNRRACQTAHWLSKNGVGYDDRVAILAPNGIAFVDLFFACGKIGAVFVPLNWRLTVPELAWIVENSTPKLLVVDETFAELAKEVAALSGRPFIITSGEFEQAIAAQPNDEPKRPSQLTPDSTHAILYTSGTTGRPKGALIPHRQVLWNAVATAVSWQLSAEDCAPILTPMFHAGGLFVFLTPLVYVGGKVVIAPTFDLDDSLQLIADEACSVVLGVPTIFQMWLTHGAVDAIDLSRVRYFISGGAPCPASLIRQWTKITGIPLRQGYGMSEVGVNCFTMSDHEALAKAGSVGKPIFFLQMRLVDQAGADVAPGETGELIIRGPQVTSGYHNNPQATAAALRGDWFYTGDMAQQDDEGYFTIVGRFKDMLISGGENVYAAEVESVLLTHPAVQECALIGKPDKKWGEVGVMFVVFHPDTEPPSDDVLKAYCAKRLARYKIPKSFQRLNELPHSPYGKVEKLKLKATYL